MKKIVIFTDLDGTLLDSDTYSFAEALPSMYLLREGDAPLIICSSKTRTEIEFYRELLDNQHPFISENGGGIFIPRGYFTTNSLPAEYKIVQGAQYNMILLGAQYKELCSVLQDLRQEGYKIKGFCDMTVEEVSHLTNLPLREAEMAKQRDFDEPFLFEGYAEDIKRLQRSIETRGYSVTRGRFFHMLGNNDKGTAVAILSQLYKKEYGEILTVGAGDSPNDLPMLKAVDMPIIVQKPDGQYDPELHLPNMIKAGDIGPKGWNKAITDIMRLRQVL